MHAVPPRVEIGHWYEACYPNRGERFERFHMGLGRATHHQTSPEPVDRVDSPSTLTRLRIAGHGVVVAIEKRADLQILHQGALAPSIENREMRSAETSPETHS